MSNPGSHLDSQLRLEKEAAFKSGDIIRFKESKCKFRKVVKEAKQLYSKKLQLQFSPNDCASLWKGSHRTQIDCKLKAPHSANDLRLANSLNEFYPSP